MKPGQSKRKDRRETSERRQHQLELVFPDRRKTARRETELQAFLWHAQQVRA